MLSTIVQFIRNFLCCVKDLNWFSNTWLYDATVTAQYYEFPGPLSKTTPLEAITSVTHLYAVVSNLYNGMQLMLLSMGKIRRIDRITATLIPATDKTDTDRLIRASLVKERFYAVRSLWIGFLVFCIGGGFFWFFANCYHITETNWIGGVAGLINALSVMELCLLPLLYYMIKDGMEQIAKATRMVTLSKKMQAGAFTKADCGISSVEQLASWVPFWDAGISPLAPPAKDEKKLLEIEHDKVQSTLKTLLNQDKDDKAKQEMFWNEKAEGLIRQARVEQLEGYRELLYFVINAVAFYGYLMAVLVYYWPDELKQPAWVRAGMGHYSNVEADWMGNFAGDFMWTIEPLIIMGSPWYLARVKAEPVTTVSKPKLE